MADTNVSTQRGEIATALARGKLVQDLLGGTKAMQAAAEAYIPKRKGEPDGKYQARVDGAVLLNAYKRTVAYLSGQVFSKEVGLSGPGEGDNANVGQVFESMGLDADLQGNNLTVWAGHFFRDAVNRGLGLLIVDYPMVRTRRVSGVLEYEAEPGVWLAKTAAVDKAAGWRPYFVHVSLADILGYRFERINGKRVLTQLRFMERVTEKSGTWDTDDETVDQVRVLTPGRWETWREIKNETGKTEWALYDGGETSIGVVPAAWFMTGEPNGELCALPALEDLAQLNRRHWRSYAEHCELMGWVRAPGMYATGVDVDTELPWGPGQLTKITDPNGKMAAIGVDAPSVEASRVDLKDLEERMALYGLQMLMPQQSGTVTATASALDATESDSTLQSWAKALADCMEQGFKFAAMWAGLGEEAAPGVDVNTDYHMLSGLDPQAILLAVDKGVVPKRMAFEEFKRRGLQTDADWQEAQAEMENDLRSGQSAPAAGLAADLLGQQGQQGA